MKIIRMIKGTLDGDIQIEINDTDSIQQALNNVDVFGQLGLAIGRSTTLKELSFIGKWRDMNDINVHEYDGDSVEENVQDHDGEQDSGGDNGEAHCIGALLNGIKDNRSIKYLRFFLFPHDFTITFMNGFLTNNEIDWLMLEGEGSNDQAIALANISLQVKRLHINCWKREDCYSAVGRLLVSCLRVQCLRMQCDLIHLIYISTLLCIPQCQLQRLDFDIFSDFTGYRLNDNLFRALCNKSSINSICQSNHSLKCVDTFSSLSPNVEKCLELNKRGVNFAIHKKVFLFYFEGAFDITPFRDLPVSAMAKILSDIKNYDKRRNVDTERRDLSAVYRLVRAFPALLGGKK